MKESFTPVFSAKANADGLSQASVPAMDITPRLGYLQHIANGTMSA
jgi:hypothetical protein